MTAMTEQTGSGALTRAAEPESATAAAQDETSLLEDFENILEISQNVGLTGCAASEGTDGQTVPPPADQSSSTESQWVVGAQCQAMWSEDGRLYPAKVVSLDGQRCRVRFSGYENEQEVELGALKSPDAALQTLQNCEDWKPGSRCRAVYSGDGLVYPAVVLWVKGPRCCIRFDDYNNEEEQDIGSLLNPDELQGPSRTTAAKGGSRKSSVTSGSSGWKKREENQGERGGEGRGRDDQPNSSWVKPSNQSNVEKEAEKSTNHSVPFFLPFPPPPQSTSGEPVSFIPPPPPPLWMFGGKESSSSMLMLWYMCGFHTGSYMAQQEFKWNSEH